MTPRQPHARFGVAFRLAADANGDALEAWLRDTLGEDQAALAGSAAFTGDAARAAAWLQRALLVTRAMMQAARMPVFDEPRILAVTETAPGEWQGTIQFPFVELVPPKAVRAALGGGVKLCAEAQAHAHDRAAWTAYVEHAQQKVIDRVAPFVPGAKSTIPTLRAAHALGIPFMHLGRGVYQLGWGSRARRIDRSTTDRDSAMGLGFAQGKADTARLLRLAGLPAPEHTLVTTPRAALDAAKALGWPVVVKPSDRDRGEGVTVDVAGDEALAAAFEHARSASRQRTVLVERQVPGVCHRVFVAAGSVLYAVKRMPMSVQGDGRSSVETLVAAAVASDALLAPWARSGIQPLDALADAALARAGLSRTSVPAAGAWVPLRRIESTEWGGVDEDVTATIHPQNAAVAVRASAVFGLEVAGIDILTDDVTKPWHETGAIINEVNYAPLLGGGAISRSHIPEFLRRLLPGGGRIPVELFVGGEPARAASVARRAALGADGVRCWWTSRVSTLDASGTPVVFAATDLVARTQALVLGPDVDAMVIHATRAEFERSGPPLPGLSAVFVDG